MEREPQDDEDRKDRDRNVEGGILLECRKPVVVDRHDPGQPYPSLIITGQLQITSGLSDGIRRRAPWLQCREIEYRLELDKAPQLWWRRRFSAGQDAPGKAGGIAGKRFANSIGRHRHWPGKIVEPDLPVLDAHQTQRQRAEASFKTRICGKLLEQRTGIEKTVGNPRNLIGR